MFAKTDREYNGTRIVIVNCCKRSVKQKASYSGRGVQTIPSGVIIPTQVTKIHLFWGAPVIKLVDLGGGAGKMMTLDDRGGWGGLESQNLDYVICEWPLTVKGNASKLKTSSSYDFLSAILGFLSELRVGVANIFCKQVFSRHDVVSEKIENDFSRQSK